MSITLGEAILYLRGDGSDLDKSLRDADKKSRGIIGGITDFADKGFTGLKKSVGVGLVAGIGAATAGVAALGAGLVSAVAAGSDVEEMMGKFSVVFANTGDKVTSQLDEFGRAVGRNKYELREMAATFGDTLKPMGFAESDAADLSVTLSKLAVDLGSFNNMETDEALSRLQGTLIGSHENALAFGVIINENTLKAELAANGWDQLTGAQLEQAKVQARINLLMKGTTDAQGDAARTSGGWANQVRRLQSILQETRAEIGSNLLPVLTPLLTKLGDLAVGILPVISTGLRYVSDLFSHFTRALDKGNGVAWAVGAALFNVFDGAPWLDGVVSALDIVQDFFDGMARGEGVLEAVAVMLVNSFDGAPWLDGVLNAIDFAKKLIATISETVRSFVSWEDVLIALGIVAASIVIPILAGIVASAAPVIAVGAALVASVALVRKAWESDWGGIRTALTGWWEGTGKPIFGQVRTWLEENLPKALSTLSKWWQDYLLPAIRAVWSFVDTYLIPLFGALVNVWFAALRVQLAVLQAAFENVFLPALRSVWSFISTYIIPIFDGMTSSIGGIGGAIQTVIGWLQSLGDKLNSVANRIPDIFRPGSPTPFELGFRGIADGIREMERSAAGLTLNGSLRGAMAGIGGGDTYNVTIPQNFSGNADPASVGRAARGGVSTALEMQRRRGR